MDDLGDFKPAPDRADPIDLLEEQAQTRVPSLVPIRYGRMLESPFAFYRGAALIMAADLASMPRSSVDTQICGDAHLMNFGVYGTPERRMVFDINDFDETHRGPFEWDMRRFVASLEIAGRWRGDKGKVRRAAIAGACEQYVSSMRAFAEMGNLEVWYARIDVEDLLTRISRTEGKQSVKEARKTVDKYRTRTSLQALKKLTVVEDGRLRFRSDPPLLERVDDVLRGMMTVEQMGSFLDATSSGYAETLSDEKRWLLSQYRLVDVARKVVGVGSVGTRAWVALFVGRDEGDPLFLQFKQAQASVVERFTEPSPYEECGERVVAGQRLMQAASDIFLGWERVLAPTGETQDYYVRQLRDWKGSAEVATMTPQRFAAYAKVCAWTLAKAHARAGDRVQLADYLGNGVDFAEQMGAFAAAYADQNEHDYAALVAAVESGRVSATPGV